MDFNLHREKMSSANRKGSLLLTVLRDLTDSYDEEERRSQRKKLKAEQERAQAALNRVIGDHQERLQLALDVYTKVDARIRASQERVAFLKKKLTECQSLLRCKQEDLRQLWIENVKYKQMLKLFDTIEKVKAVPEEVARFRSRKHYLHASETLMYNIQLVSGKLGGVEALKEIRLELQNLQDALHLEILEEINKHLYIKPKPKPKVVSEVKSKDASPLMIAKRATIGKHSRTLSRTIQMEHEAALRLAQLAAKSQTKDVVEEDLTLLDPEENSSYYMDILVESLQNLGTIDSALTEIQGERMEREFRSIVDRIAIQVIRSAENSGWHQHKAKLLATLLEKSFDKFRAVVDAHSLILVSFQRVKKSYGLSIELYSENEIWTAIQQVLQSLLSEYFEIDRATDVGSSGMVAEASDLSSFFQKKKWANPKGRPVYFKFDQSDHMLMRREQNGEKKNEVSEGQYQSLPATPLVCPPTIFNVTKTFSIICDFATEIESTLRFPQDEPCALRSFVVSFVEHKFIDDIGHDFQEQLEKAIAGDNVAKLVDAKQQKITGLPKKILACVVVVWQLVERLKKLIADLPVYSTQFLVLMTRLLEEFHQCMEGLYRNVVSTGIGQSLIGHSSLSVLSAKWSQEEEVLRLVKKSPSWNRIFGKEKGNEVEPSHDQGLSTFERETDFLFRMLPPDGHKVERKEIIDDVLSLKKIAHIHESVVCVDAYTLTCFVCWFIWHC
jgi:exocyst complex component 4